MLLHRCERQRPAPSGRVHHHAGESSSATDEGGLSISRPVGHTNGMKTAVSLPDELFHAAERHARRSSRSRSRLYADAIAEYLARHAPDEVTEAMDRVVERLGETATDEFVGSAARQTLERSEW